MRAENVVREDQLRDENFEREDQIRAEDIARQDQILARQAAQSAQAQDRSAAQANAKSAEISRLLGVLSGVEVDAADQKTPDFIPGGPERLQQLMPTYGTGKQTSDQKAVSRMQQLKPKLANEVLQTIVSGDEKQIRGMRDLATFGVELADKVLAAPDLAAKKQIIQQYGASAVARGESPDGYVEMLQIPDKDQLDLAARTRQVFGNDVKEITKPQKPTSLFDTLEKRLAFSQLIAIDKDAADIIVDLEKNRLESVGHHVLSPEEIMSMGLPSGSYQQSPDGKITSIGGGGQTINVQAGDGNGVIEIDDKTGRALIADPDAEGGMRWVDIEGGISYQDSLQSNDQIDSLLDAINSQIAEPGVDLITGVKGSFIGDGEGRLSRAVLAANPEAARALSRHNQIQGKIFLDAYERLKGGGQITEVEGRKAESAMARLFLAQSAEDYRESLTELRDFLSLGRSRPIGWADIQGGTAEQPAPVERFKFIPESGEFYR